MTSGYIKFDEDPAPTTSAPTLPPGWVAADEQIRLAGDGTGQQVAGLAESKPGSTPDRAFDMGSALVGGISVFLALCLLAAIRQRVWASFPSTRTRQQAMQQNAATESFGGAAWLVWVKTNPFLVLAATTVVIAICLSRYEVQTTRYVAYRLDRWTGEVERCVPIKGCSAMSSR